MSDKEKLDYEYFKTTINAVMGNEDGDFAIVTWNKETKKMKWAHTAATIDGSGAISRLLRIYNKKLDDSFNDKDTTDSI